MSRKDFFKAIRGVEGGEDLEKMAEKLFGEADAEAKSYRENAQAAETKNKTFAEEVEELRDKAGKAEELSTQNNDFASQMDLLTKQVGVLTDANTEITREKQALIQDKKDGDLKTFFTDAVSGSFGADGARMAFNDALASKSIDNTGESTLYKGKSGDEAIEAFKTDYSATFMQNKGTGTTGGKTPVPAPKLDGLSVDALLANNGALLK